MSETENVKWWNEMNKVHDKNQQNNLFPWRQRQNLTTRRRAWTPIVPRPWGFCLSLCGIVYLRSGLMRSCVGGFKAAKWILTFIIGHVQHLVHRLWNVHLVLLRHSLLSGDKLLIMCWCKNSLTVTFLLMRAVLPYFPLYQIRQSTTFPP